MARPKKDAAVASEETGAQAPVESGEAVVTTDVAADESAAAEEEAGMESPQEPVAEAAEEAAEFPKELTVQNNTPSELVFPLIKSTVPSYSELQAVFESEDQLARFKSDAAQICEVNGWTDGIVVVE